MHPRAPREYLNWLVAKSEMLKPPDDAGHHYELDLSSWQAKPLALPFQTRRRAQLERKLRNSGAAARQDLRVKAAGA